LGFESFSELEKTKRLFKTVKLSGKIVNFDQTMSIYPYLPAFDNEKYTLINAELKFSEKVFTKFYSPQLK
jgi:hypothetical protein